MSAPGVCIICGDHPDTYSSDWGLKFRVLYRGPHGFGISGVGDLADDPMSWTAPLVSKGNSHEHISIRVPGELNENGYDGMVLHDACWLLLQQSARPYEVDLAQLYSICCSLEGAGPHCRLFWPHAFGDVLTYDPLDKFHEHMRATGLGAYHQADPLHIPDLDCMIESCKGPEYLPLPKGNIRSEPNDIFAQLPLELRDEIAAYAGMEDAKALRLASLSFASLFSRNFFWASRFRRSAERGHVFEIQDINHPCDWFKLYRESSKQGGGLHNRARIWDCLQYLRIILQARREMDRSAARQSNLIWAELAWDYQDLRRHRYHNRNVPFSCEKAFLELTTHMRGVAFSVLETGSVTYITGLRIIVGYGFDSCIGLILPCQHETFVETKAIHGFRIALATSGVKAIQVLQEDRSLTSWIGVPGETPTSDRLMLEEPIRELSVTLDGFKIMGIGAGVMREEAEAETEHATSPQPLRHTGIWHPSLPPPGLNLNEAAFSGRDHSRQYLGGTFTWTHFGGLYGRLLPYVTGLGLTRGGGSLLFYYNEHPELQTHTVLGALPSEDDIVDAVHFGIDGRHGERIIGIHLELTQSGEELDSSIPRRIKFVTNHHQEVELELNCTEGATTPHSSFAPDGEVITGFYVEESLDCSKFRSFGIITEAVEV